MLNRYGVEDFSNICSYGIIVLVKITEVEKKIWLNLDVVHYNYKDSNKKKMLLWRIKNANSVVLYCKSLRKNVTKADGND